MGRNVFLYVIVISLLLTILGNLFGHLFPEHKNLVFILHVGLQLAVAPHTFRLILAVLWSRKVAGAFTLYTMAHPLLVLALVALNVRLLPEGYACQELFLSLGRWFLKGILFFQLLFGIRAEEYRPFARWIWYLGMIVGLEGLISFWQFQLHSGPVMNFNEAGRFMSIFFLSNAFAGILGICLYAFSIYFTILEGRKKRYIAGLIIGVILQILCQERSVLIGFLLFNVFLLFQLKYLGKYLKWTLGLFSATSFILFFVKKSFSAISNFSSLFERFMRFARGMDIAYNYFPLGVGGGSSSKYQFDFMTPTTFSRPMLGFSEYDPVMKIQFQKIFNRIVDPEYQAWESLHSTWLDLVADFGILGIWVLILAFYYPIKYFYQANFVLGFNQQNEIDHKKLERGKIWATLLIGLSFPLAMQSLGHAFFLELSTIYIAFYFVHYREDLAAHPVYRQDMNMAQGSYG